jgi:hypothetical protein
MLIRGALPMAKAESLHKDTKKKQKKQLVSLPTIH